MKAIYIILAVALFFSFQGCKKDKTDNDKTVANFIPTGLEARVPTDISFFNSSKNATSFFWKLGDGSTSTEANPIHNYTTIGTYFITLKATGPNGVDSVCKQITLGKAADPSKTDISYYLDKCDNTTPVSAIFHTINPLSIFPAWDFGGGVTSLEKSPIVRFTGPGSFLIKHSTQINGVRDTITLGLTFF